MLICAIGADRAALGARHVSCFRDANQLEREFFAHAEPAGKVVQFIGRKRLANVNHGRQAHVWLVVAVAANGFVIAYPGKGRLDLVSRGFECGSEKSFDNRPD